MLNSEKIYTALCIVFSVLIVLGNMVYQKFVALAILPFHTFELSVGAILYPLTFLITDLIAEFFGKEKAKFCVKFAMLANVMAALIIMGMDLLPATDWSKIDDSIFHKVFGMYAIAFIGSTIACYSSQAIDIYLYLGIKRLTKGKYLWLRNNGSTAISLFIDTTIVISFMTLFGIFEVNVMWNLIFNSYLFKIFFTICSTPLFYFAVYLIGRFIKKTD